jgi:hypothetical protein
MQTAGPYSYSGLSMKEKSAALSYLFDADVASWTGIFHNPKFHQNLHALDLYHRFLNWHPSRCQMIYGR